MKKNQLAYFTMSILVVCLIAVLSGCGDDGDAAKKTVDVDDPNAVAQSLTIENASFINGMPPAPTGGNAPVISEEETQGDIFTIQGLKVIVDAPLESGDAAGFYVTITGADGYFKITSPKAPVDGGRLAEKRKRDLFKSGRTQEDDIASFSIEVPEGIEPGEFCISYCVYDAQNQVSNIIERCVVVSELGGSNASFLTKEWSWLSSETYYDGVLEYEEFAGVPSEYTYETSIYCGEDYQIIEVTDTDLTDYVYLKFSSNGAFQVQEKYSYTYYDYESECTPEYITEAYEETWTGAWSYDDESKQLVIIYNLYDEEYAETAAQAYEAEVVNGKLVLTASFDEIGYTDVITLEQR